MLANTVVIIQQYINVSNQTPYTLKLTQYYLSIMSQLKKKEKIKHPLKNVMGCLGRSHVQKMISSSPWKFRLPAPCSTSREGNVSWETLRLLVSSRVTLQNFKVQELSRRTTRTPRRKTRQDADCGRGSFLTRVGHAPWCAPRVCGYKLPSTPHAEMPDQ